MADELKTKVDLMEKRVMYLVGTVNFYRYGFGFLVILVTFMTVAIILMIVFLKETKKKMSKMDAFVQRMRRDMLPNAGNANIRDF